MSRINEHFQSVPVRFQCINLDDIQQVALMNRVDTKYTIPSNQLQHLLSQVQDEYQSLEIGGVIWQRYQTLYFDTPEFRFYHQHHNGVFPRYKVRLRQYVDSNSCFLEIKRKSNKGRTEKRRLPISDIHTALTPDSRDFLKLQIPDLNSGLSPALWVSFSRLTLINKEASERITIDLDLRFKRGEDTFQLPEFAVIEVKRDGKNHTSPLTKAIQQLRVPSKRMSKYCFGVMNLVPDVKHNLFKERFNHLLKNEHFLTA